MVELQLRHLDILDSAYGNHLFPAQLQMASVVLTLSGGRCAISLAGVLNKLPEQHTTGRLFRGRLCREPTQARSGLTMVEARACMPGIQLASGA